MARIAQIGSISHGTLRSEDLLASFADELDRLDADGVYAKLVKEARDTVENAAQCDVDASPEEQESEDELVNELSDALNDFAPAWCRFGAHEGDGSDFGFWPLIDDLEDAVRDGEVLKVSDLSELPDDYIGDVMLVNDHGNVTLGRTVAQFVESWACV